MGVVYLAALLVGAGILSLGLFGHGGDAHADFHGLDVHGHLGHAGHDADAAHQNAQPSIVGLAMLLSLRFWSFGLMAFGLVGTLIRWLALAGPLATGFIAAVVGLFSGALAASVFRALGRASLSSGGESNEALGQLGRVLLPIAPGQMGKIRVEVRGRLVDLLATTDGERLEGGTTVIVNRLEGATAQVSAAPEMLRTKADER